MAGSYREKSPVAKESGEYIKPLVSIIITTRNEDQHISACLRSIKRQTYKPIEIIVVDNNSTDRTKVVARDHTRLIFDAGPERSAQRNFGAKKAKGEYLLFLDADMVLTPKVVEESVSLIINHKSIIHAVTIPEKSFGIGFWARCKALERECYEGVGWMEAARFYRKEIFEKLGGFDDRLTGPEDFELSQRVKAKYGNESVGRLESYILHNEGELSLANLIQKKYYYGKRMDRYRKLTESRGFFKKQANIFFRFGLFFRRPEIFIRNPIHAFGMLIMKTLEMAALSVGGLGK